MLLVIKKYLLQSSHQRQLKYFLLSLVVVTLSSFAACKSTSKNDAVVSSADSNGRCTEDFTGEKIYTCEPGWLEGDTCLYCPPYYDYHSAFKSCYNGSKLHSMSAVRPDLKRLIGCKVATPVQPLNCNDVLSRVCQGNTENCTCAYDAESQRTAVRLGHCKSFKTWFHEGDQYAITDVSGLELPKYPGLYSRDSVVGILQSLLNTILDQSKKLKSGEMKPGDGPIRCEA
jgi:hypothetical protein